MPEPIHRVVSLIASATEIVAALGGEDQLVGRSHECDFPPSVARLPVCSSPRIDVHASSLEIDRQVKSSLLSGLSIYEVDAAQLERLQPTLILTQTQCDVCAVSVQDVERALCATVSSRPRIVALEAMDLADVWRDVQLVAEALDVPERGRELQHRGEARLRALAPPLRKGGQGGSGGDAPAPAHPTVASIEWLDPLMSAGNWVPELVEIAGGRNLFGRAGQHSPFMTWDELVAGNPDVIVLMPCGFDIPRTLHELPALTSHPAWPGLRAVRDGRVFVTDGNQYFNRPGPRLVDSAEILAEILYPASFDFGYRGRGWVALHDN